MNKFINFLCFVVAIQLCFLIPSNWFLEITIGLITYGFLRALHSWIMLYSPPDVYLIESGNMRMYTFKESVIRHLVQKYNRFRVYVIETNDPITPLIEITELYAKEINDEH